MTLFSELNAAVNEKDVENIYRKEILSIVREAKIVSPCNVDGIIIGKDLNTLLEFKFNLDLKQKINQCIVLIQVLYYLKSLENSGYLIPSTILVGDKNECFIIHSNSLIKYLKLDIDWSIAPSKAYKENLSLLYDMEKDDDLIPFVFDVDENFSLTEVIKEIIKIGKNVVRKLRISQLQAPAAFRYFDKNVLNQKLTINEKANLFIQILINSDENYLHPKKKNVLVSKSLGEIKVKENTFISFFRHFEGELYSPKEKEQLTSFVDVLVEEETRRSKGEFFTPPIFVHEADKYISEGFGNDWKEKYIVWDCAWGTGNLTRDFTFRELYCSTIEQSDIDTANQMGYNPEAVKFQFDFLNDPDEKLPSGLKAALDEGKEIIFFINPPYGKAAGEGKRNKIKTGSANTLISKEMKEADFGGTAQLYAQFLYRIWKYNKNSNIHICFYGRVLYKTGSSFEKFRKKFYSKFRYEKGFLFNAGHFDGTSNAWGVDFSIWKSGEETRHSLPIDVVEVKNGFVYKVREKQLWNMDNGRPLNKWINYRPQIIEFPKFSSALKIKESKHGFEIDGKSFSALISNSNNIRKNVQDVYIMNGGTATNIGKFFINKETFNKCVMIFAARRCIQDNWIKNADEYSQPTKDIPEEFLNDSIVYGLFNKSSQQSSLRQVIYKGKLWDIKNEFFWLSKQQMLDLAEEYRYDELYQDAKRDKERFVYERLQNITLSKEAQNVLNAATKLTIDSFPYRKLEQMAGHDPDWHLHAWDAGYAQLKLLWKKYYKKEFDEFRKLYKILEDKLIPQVYELGFLRDE